MSVALSWMLTYLLHSTVLLGIAALVSRTMLVRGTRGRELLWRAAMFGAIASATLHQSRMWLPGVDLRVFDPARDSLSGTSADAWSSAFELVRGIVGVDLVDWTTLIGVCCLVTAAIAIGRVLTIAVQYVALRRALDRRQQLAGPLLVRLRQLSADPGARLSVCARLTGPLTMGREVCLPPRVFDDLSTSELDTVIAHEAAHVRRRDTWWRWATLLVDRLLFFQPLNRVACRELHALAECACDDWAVAQTGDAAALAHALGTVATWLVHGSRPGLALSSAMASDERLSVIRVRRLLHVGFAATREETRLRRVAVAFIPLLGMLVGGPTVRARQSVDSGTGVDAVVTIRGHDPAGRFTLTILHERVLAASIDDTPVAPDRIRHGRRHATVVGSDGQPILSVAITRGGHGLSWTPRPAR
jgi:beta-lactamase regulating signal transducer with metallopeptidase domain